MSPYSTKPTTTKVMAWPHEKRGVAFAVLNYSEDSAGKLSWAPPSFGIVLSVEEAQELGEAILQANLEVGPTRWVKCLYPSALQSGGGGGSFEVKSSYSSVGFVYVVWWGDYVAEPWVGVLSANESREIASSLFSASMQVEP